MQRARRFLRPLKLSVEGSALDVFFFSPKKYRPPRPMGVKGGCSPQNNLPKSGRYYPSLNGAATKIYINYTAPFRKPFASPVRMSILRVIPTIGTRRISNYLRKVAMRVLILHAQCVSGKTAQSRRIASGRTSQHARPELSPSSPFYFGA